MANENEYGKISNEIIGVYKIECNGKCYVGSSSRSIAGRWKEHIKDLNKGNHHNKYLQNVYNKHGRDAFLFSILEIVERKEDVITAEQKYIDNLKPEFNICPTAGSWLGNKQTEEAKQKLRDRIVSEETRQKIRDVLALEEVKQKMCNRFTSEETMQKMQNRIVSEEIRQKIRDALASEEVKQKMRESSLGYRHTEEAKQKMRDRVVSEETRQKMSASRLGKKYKKREKDFSDKTRKKIFSDEIRKKLSDLRLGRPCSEETKQKIRETKLRKKLLNENATEITTPESV